MSVAAGTGVQNHSFVPHVQADAFDSAMVAMQPAETRMILIVGANVRLMEWAALSLFRAGHIPVLGQWFWPLLTSDAAAAGADLDDYGDPIAERLIGRCDAVLRVDGHAPDADALVNTARARGLRVHFTLDDAIAG